MFFTILASLFISAISLLGAILLLKSKEAQKRTGTLVSFAAGVMLSAAFLDLLPEALEGAGEMNVFIPTLIGVVSFFFLERFVLWFHHHHDGHGATPSAVLVLIGDSFHNFIDGVAIAAAFLVSPTLGVITTLAIAFHEIPQELADLSVLVAGGLKQKRALFYNFLSGLTALAGAVIGYIYLESVEKVIWMFLSFTAGMFLYIACSDLIPELHQQYKKHQNWTQTLPFIFGIIIMQVFIKIIEG